MSQHSVRINTIAHSGIAAVSCWHASSPSRHFFTHPFAIAPVESAVALIELQPFRGKDLSVRHDGDVIIAVDVGALNRAILFGMPTSAR
jgi:hypothetical protein